MNTLHTLIIDDHPLIANAYKQALEKVVVPWKKALKVDIVHTIEEALKKIEDEAYFKTLHLVILDIRLPKGKQKSVLSGEDLGMIIKKRYPQLKVIIATMFNDNYRVHSILKNVDPEGLLVKNDLTPDELMLAIENVLTLPPYYSKTVLKMIRKQLSANVLLDSIDRRLLYELSIGTKMKDLPEILPLSKAGIERRKRNLKLIFDVGNESDRELVLQAKERGFI